MIDLIKLSQNPVTLLRTHYEPEIYLKIPSFILKNAKATVFSMVDEYSQSENLNQVSDDKKFTFLDFHQLKEIILDNLRQKRDTIDFCSILIINDIHTLTLEKLILINLWKECYKISSKRPYLIITTFSDYTPELPFKLPKDACQVFGKPRKIDIQYHETNFSPNSKKIESDLSEIIIDKHKNIPVKSHSTWLVFYCGKENLSKTLYNKIGKEANIYTTNSIKKLNRFRSQGKRNIIILCDEYIPPTLMNHVDGIFDSMIVSVEENINYSSKQVSETRASYQENGFVFRLCTHDYYKELPKISRREYDKNMIKKYYLQMIQNKLNLENIFGTILTKPERETCLEYLRKQGSFSGEIVTKLGEFNIHLPLTLENSSLFYLAYSNNFPVFPCIVATVLSEIKEPLFADKENEDSFYNHVYKFNSILMENTDLDEINISDVSKHFSVNPRSLTIVLEKIKSIISILRDVFDIKFEIGVYNTKNLIEGLIPYYEKAFFEDTYLLIDKDSLLYKNKDKIFKLDRERFHYKKQDPPERIFSFYRARKNQERTSIQKGKNMIYYYVAG